MKKIIAISLLALLLFSSAGNWLIFKFQQQLNYCVIQQKIKKAENLTSITLSCTDYKKSKVDDHEILLNGKMYDVEQRTFHSDSITLLCIADDKEDALIFSYHTHTKKQSEKNNSNQQLIKLLSLIYLQTGQDIISPQYIDIVVYHLAYQFSFKPEVVFIESPPPKIA